MIDKPIDHPFPDKLSCLMICKNEAEHIIPIISQVQKFADEIIVNDTGSTDDSIKLLSRMDKVRLIQSKWMDSFSVARNQAKSHASYGWLMWIDFDDRIPEPEIEKIKKLKGAPLDRIFNFRVICTEDGLPIGSTLNQTRMFPNHPDINWSRRVHEQFVDCCDKMGLERIYTTATIHHTGYEDKELKDRKWLRNLALMEMDEKEYGNDMNFIMAKADCYNQLYRHDEAIAMYKRIYADKIRDTCPDFYNMAACRIGNAYFRANNFKTAIEWYNKTSDLIEAYYYKAQSQEKLGFHDSAINNYIRVIGMPYRISHQGSHFERCKMYSFNWCCRLLYSAGRNNECIELLNKMREFYPGISLDD